MRIETEERFSPWLWYVGALHQHHMGLLMLMEVFMFPNRKENTTIWRYLDWIFEVPILIKPQQKARYVMTMVRDHMAQYVSTKHLRCPTNMNVGLPSRRSGKSRSTSSSQNSPDKATMEGVTMPVVTGTSSSNTVTPPAPMDRNSSFTSASSAMSAPYQDAHMSSQETQASHNSLIDGLGRAALVQTGIGDFYAPELDVDWVSNLVYVPMWVKY